MSLVRPAQDSLDHRSHLPALCTPEARRSLAGPLPQPVRNRHLRSPRSSVPDLLELTGQAQLTCIWGTLQTAVVRRPSHAVTAKSATAIRNW
jgi:hypothetical protein